MVIVIIRDIFGQKIGPAETAIKNLIDKFGSTLISENPRPNIRKGFACSTSQYVALCDLET